MIEPDAKDWTWVLERPCPECGFDARADHDLPNEIRDNAAAWRAVAHVFARPDPQTWSPLEYTCHVRDVFVLYGERLELMLTQDDPLFPNWDQDATAIEQRYAEQDPGQVVTALEEAAAHLADAFEQLTADQWHRPGRRSDGATFTVDSFSRYFLHDVVHHRHDVRA